jgi:hypothetical protein
MQAAEMRFWEHRPSQTGKEAARKRASSKPQGISHFIFIKGMPDGKRVWQPGICGLPAVVAVVRGSGALGYSAALGFARIIDICQRVRTVWNVESLNIF